MNKILNFIFSCLAFATLKAQVLQRQMISSQGVSVRTPSGMVITQTVGQLSIIGTISSRNFLGSQGFQQLAITKANVFSSISNVSVFPNPFTSTLTVELPNMAQGSLVPVSLFDLQGRLVYTGSHFVLNEVIELQLSTLSNGVYLLIIQTKNINYSTKLIKQ